MGKNQFLERQKITNQAYFDAGLQMGRQQILDMMCLAMNDPDVMEKDVFGKKRLSKIVNAIGEYIDVFQKAWERDDETDYYRAKMDEKLSVFLGDEFHESFDKRYPYCSDFDYMKGKWKK